MRYWLLRTLVRFGPRIPVRVMYALAGFGGLVMWCTLRRVREVSRDHARHVLGPSATSAEVDRVARAAARAVGYYYADFARLKALDPNTLFDSIDEIEGVDHLFAAVDRGQGVILISAHLGSPEMLAQAATPFGLCMASITEPLSPPRLHAFVHEVRRAHGGIFIPADRAGLRSSVEHLKAGGTLAILADRDVHGTADRFPFFGERARIPSGAIELARRTGAPILVVWTPRTGLGHFSLYIQPVDLPPATGDRAADIESGMQTMIRALEAGIARWPEQWFVVSPVWGDEAARRRDRGMANL